MEAADLAAAARLAGQITCNSIIVVLDAAANVLELAYVPEDIARPHIEAGQLRVVLGDWCSPIQGYHLYYPNRRLASPAFARFLGALRYRTQGTAERP